MCICVVIYAVLSCPLLFLLLVQTPAYFQLADLFVCLLFLQTEKAKCTLLLDQGAKDLFLGWLAEEIDDLESVCGANISIGMSQAVVAQSSVTTMLTQEAITLLRLLVEIISEATWTPQEVLASRYDRRIRQVYKQLSSYLRLYSPDDDDNDEKNEDEDEISGAQRDGELHQHLQPVRALIAYLKKVWTRYRALFRQGEIEEAEAASAADSVVVKSERM